MFHHHTYKGSKKVHRKIDVKNVFLSVKVGFFNEMENICDALDINYENVRCIATDDKRIGSNHTKVPGHDGKRGFGGTCFPKDTSSLRYEMQNSGMKSYVLDAIVERNDKVDRPEKDWMADKGRAAIDD